MATAELAAALPVLLLVTLCAVTALSVMQAQSKAQDAAREAARLAARGDQVGARRAVTRRGLAGARLTLSERQDMVIAYVSVTARPAFMRFLEVDISATSVAIREPAG